MLFLFLHVCFASKFQQDTLLNVSMSSQNYAECLQTEYDNRRDFNIKVLHVNSTSKLYTININSKFRFSLEQVSGGEHITKAQDEGRSLCYIKSPI